MSTIMKQSPKKSYEFGQEKVSDGAAEISRGRMWVVTACVENTLNVKETGFKITGLPKSEESAPAEAPAPAPAAQLSPENQFTSAQPANAEIDVKARASQKTAAQPVNYTVAPAVVDQSRQALIDQAMADVYAAHSTPSPGV